MARLPSPQDLGTNIPQSGARVVSFDAGAVPAATARFGATIGQIGEHYKQEKERIDALRVEDTFNQLQQARLELAVGDDGFKSLRGSGVMGRDVLKDYTGKYDSVVARLGDELTPEQRELFNRKAANLRLGYQYDILDHTRRESDIYEGEVLNGTLQTSGMAAARNWSNPDEISAHVERSSAALDAYAKRTGKPSDWLESEKSRQNDAIYSGVMASALDAGDMDTVESYLGRFGDKMGVSTYMKASAALKEYKDNEQVNGAIAAFVDVAHQSQQPFSHLFSAVKFAESGDMGDIIDGKVVTGSAIAGRTERAIGAWQMLPSTGPHAAKEAGVKWDDKLFHSPTAEGTAYRETLASAYLKMLLRNNPGDVEAALAAYNAGQGNVDKAKKEWVEKWQGTREWRDLVKNPHDADDVRRAQEEWENRPGSWLDLLPKPDETKPYVAKIVRQFNAAPAYTRPSKTSIRAEASERFPGRPEMQKKFVTEVERVVTTIEADLAANVEDAKERIYGLMEQGVSFNQVPYSLMSRIPNKDRSAVRSAFNAYLGATPREDDDALLYELTSDPRALTEISNAAWAEARSRLSGDTWDRLNEQRKTLLSGDTSAYANIDSGSIGTLMNRHLRSLGIDPTPKHNNTNAVKRVNAVRRVLEGEVYARQWQKQRKLTDGEVEQAVNDMFSTGIIKTGFLGSDKFVPVVEQVRKVSDIPRATRENIRRVLHETGTPYPDDEDILAAYYRAALSRAQ